RSMESPCSIKSLSPAISVITVMHIRRHSRTPLHLAGCEFPVEEPSVELAEESVHIGSRIDKLVRRIHQAAHRVKNAARRLVEYRPPSPKLSTSSMRQSMSAVRRLGRRPRRHEHLQYTSLVEDDHLAETYMN
ncbi:hypothetical protein PENTCL1PPCAC_1462, partial [Pristionchus entomophagus]